MLLQTDQNLLIAANARKAIAAALFLTGLAQVDAAHAVALATGDFLTITRATVDANNYVTGGSYFGMDTDGNSKVAVTEKAPISYSRGGANPGNAFVGNIVIGTSFTATGTHTGYITGDETAAFDVWDFAGNTGMDYFTTVPTDNDDGTIGWSGWRVTWNGIPAIVMSTNAWQPANCAALGCTGLTFTNGVARITGTRANGSAYILHYTAVVPNGDPSGFGGTQYYLHLEGTVTRVGALTSSAGTVTAGSLDATRVNVSDLPAQDNTDSNINHKDGLYYDFVVTGVTAGTQVNVVIPLSTPLPANAVYRKYNSGTGLWSTFTEDAFNTVKSAAGTPDACPAAGDAAYTSGLTAGRYCIQLTILEGGANDSDAVGTTITDPGGIAVSATPPVAFVDTRAGATGGCSISSTQTNAAERGDWWLLAGFLAWLGTIFVRRRHRA